LIANLADNAVRYNVPGGSAEVTTATRDGRAVLSVRNTGAVVPASEVNRLFQPFQRLGADRVLAEGHGLGLAIVRAIADAHGASVTARAREGGGLDIAVAFPEIPP
jgi:signal transduction histidine kinase